MANFDVELANLNTRLKAAKARVAVFVRDNHLWLRATLPPKPHSTKVKPYQQLVSIGAKATVAGLNYAERRAKYMSLTLDEGKFYWSDWTVATEKTIGEIVKAYHSWKLKQSAIANSTFTIDYLRPSQKLPAKKRLDINLILEAIGETKPDSRTRKRLAQYCGRLGKFAGMKDEDLEKISLMVGNYSAIKVNPRKLPSDKVITDAVNKHIRTEFGWLLAIIATYGLRSHEAFNLELLEYPKMKVVAGKTGERIVWPLFPEWVEDWELWQLRPPRIKFEDNADLSSKISSWFSRRNLGFKSLDLRHSYARRCFEFGIAPDRAAFMMGHSHEVHMRTYRAWFEEELYDNVYQNAVSQKSRPLPPI